KLCVCVTAGNVDSMIANYTANKRPRREEAGEGRRPDRATIVYTNRLRAAFKGLPVILGGIEASMRRLAHYDYWDNAVRRSLLLDAKADLLIYGMGEKPILDVMARLKNGEDIRSIRGVSGTVAAVKPHDVPAEAVLLPSFEEVQKNAELFNKAFTLSYREMNSVKGKPLAQAHGDQVVMQYPPATALSTEELDASYELPYMRAWHPAYDATGGVKGLETVRFSLTVVRGCSGECSFCGLAMHQGRALQSRSERSVIAEVEQMVRHPEFRGTIADVGGPTANLYGASCKKCQLHGPCQDKQCLMPSKCPSLEIGYSRCLSLYRAIRRVKGVKHVFIGSGLRYDLLLAPEAEAYFKELVEYHVSGQMKVAPEHTSSAVLELMNKPPYERYEEFVRKFEQINARLPSRRYLVNYFISAHPGCALGDAFECAMTLLSKGMRPEQVQDFIPLPMTVSACLYHTGIHPFTGKKVSVVKDVQERELHRALLQSQNEKNEPLIRRALRLLGRESDQARFRPRKERS
ncbi:MAG: YgiQ family radical SAM protein, partial [Candidatus Omnitrophica bacterium]|nr:YgiQ family radical SAM protein [Candidatus Omnitrophota bacterium]